MASAILDAGAGVVRVPADDLAKLADEVARVASSVVEATYLERELLNELALQLRAIADPPDRPQRLVVAPGVRRFLQEALERLDPKEISMDIEALRIELDLNHGPA